MEYITVREAAGKWKVSERLAQQYCTDGRIAGARSSVEPGRFHPMHKSRPTPEKPQKMHGATLLPHALSPLLPPVSRLPCL